MRNGNWGAWDETARSMLRCKRQHPRQSGRLEVPNPEVSFRNQAGRSRWSGGELGDRIGGLLRQASLAQGIYVLLNLIIALNEEQVLTSVGARELGFHSHKFRNHRPRFDIVS